MTDDELTDAEKDALEAMTEFADLLEGDIITEESLREGIKDAANDRFVRPEQEFEF